MTESDADLFPPGEPAPPHHEDEFEHNDPLRNEPPPANVAPVVVPRWVQLVMLPLAIVAAWVIARAAGVVLLVFVVAAVVALILNPLVLMFQRRARIPRGLAVAMVYVGLLVTLTGVGFLLANPIADQAQKLSDDVPRLVDSANQSLDDLQKTFDDKGIKVEVKRQGETAVQTLAEKLGAASNDIASTATDLLRTIVTASLGLILVVVLSVYMLLYGERIGASVRRVMPPGDGTTEDDYPIRVQRAVAGYVRGQLLFSTAMGLGAGVGLWIYGKLGIFEQGDDYALAFGIFFGIMELIPFVGPILGALPPIVVALFQDPLTAVWVAILFVGLQQIEGHVVAPQIFGRTLRINPLLVIFALLLGGEIYGFLGALMALPLAAGARETAGYPRPPPLLAPRGGARPRSTCAATSCSSRGVPRARCARWTRARRRRRAANAGRSPRAATRTAGPAAPRWGLRSSPGSSLPPHGRRPGRDEALRRARRAARRDVRGAARRAAGDHRAQRRGQDDPAVDPRRAARAERRHAAARTARRRLGPAADGGLRQAHGAREPRALRPARARRRPGGGGGADARPDRAERARRRGALAPVGRQPAAGEHRGRARRRPAGPVAR